MPARFPPVQVESPDQEEEYAAKGYKPNGNPDPKAFEALKTAPPATYVHEEYPKWVGGKIVNSAEEEAKLLGSLPVVVETTEESPPRWADMDFIPPKKNKGGRPRKVEAAA